MTDKRKSERYPFTTDVKISHPDIGEKIVKTKDISDSGVFILVEPTVMPPIGEIVQGQVQGEHDDMPVVKMKIVRMEDDGLGLQFIGV
ncbi:MAG: PilZ domain-containing protein [Gammaproteobacteria bacterium]|nr:PilZ domain-containing protein [Gammaproteobacteria bacterium]